MKGIITDECKRISKQFGEDVFSDPVLRSTFDMLDAADFRNIGKACNQIISSCLRLVEIRRNADRLFEGKTIPKGVQNYLRLHLQETAKRIISSFKILRGLPVRLEITGLNRPISNFYLTRLLKEKQTKQATHVIKMRFIHNEREFLMDTLREHQIVDNSTAPFIEELLDKIPDEEAVNVLRPGDLLYPKLPEFLVPGQGEGMWENVPKEWWEDSWGGTGPGGGPSGGGGGPGVSIHIDKGMSRWMEDGISDWIDYFRHIATTDWLSGGMLYEGQSQTAKGDVMPISGKGGTRGFFNNLGENLMELGGGFAGYGALTGNPTATGVGGIAAAAGAVIIASAEAGHAIGEALGAAYCWLAGCGKSNFINW